MTKPQLPEYISLEDAANQLVLYGMPFISALKTMLMYSNQYGLRIYFNHHMFGYALGHPLDDAFDSDGEFKGYMIHEEAIFHDKEKNITKNSNASSHFDGINHLILIRTFNCNDTSYYVVDETQQWVSSQYISLGEFCIKRLELTEFFKKLESNNSNRPHTTKKHNITSQLDRRIETFKTWLATNADIDIADNSKYQNCYEKINCPTQEEVWTSLKRIDSNLFSAGRDDFFKYQAIIDFKIGTGKGRPQ